MKLVVDYSKVRAEQARFNELLASPDYQKARMSVQSVCEVVAKCLVIVTEDTSEDLYR